MLIRDGDREEVGKRVKARPRAPTRKTEEAVDRRQNSGSIKAVSPRHWVATSVLRNFCFNCCAKQSSNYITLRFSHNRLSTADASKNKNKIVRIETTFFFFFSSFF